MPNSPPLEVSAGICLLCDDARSRALPGGENVAEFLWLGSTLGALLGLTHGVYLYRRIAAREPGGDGPGGRLQGLYYAFWALLLWTLFGSYVLAFWVLGLLAYPLVRMIRGARAAA
jgi:hypothetical protein